MLAAASLAFGAHADARRSGRRQRDHGRARVLRRHELLDARRRQVRQLPFDVCSRVLGDIRSRSACAKLDIKYQPVTSQNRIPLVQNGTVDIECGSTTNNATRQKDVSFAVTTFVTEVRIAVKANSGITSIAQLSDKERRHHHRHDLGAAAAQARTRQRHRLQEVFGKGPRRQLPAARVGPRRRLVMDDYILAGLIARSKNPAGFKITGEPLSLEPIAIMIRRTTRPSRRRWTTASSA